MKSTVKKFGLPILLGALVAGVPMSVWLDRDILRQLVKTRQEVAALQQAVNELQHSVASGAASSANVQSEIRQALAELLVKPSLPATPESSVVDFVSAQRAANDATAQELIKLQKQIEQVKLRTSEVLARQSVPSLPGIKLRDIRGVPVKTRDFDIRRNTDPMNFKGSLWLAAPVGWAPTTGTPAENMPAPMKGKDPQPYSPSYMMENSFALARWVQQGGDARLI